MASLAVIIAIAIATTQMDISVSKQVQDEPVCTSRYDFESSLLRDIVKLDFDMSVLKQSYSDDITNLKKETKLATEKLETATKQMEESQAQVVSELTALGKAQKKESDDKIIELDKAKTLLQDELNTRFATLELQMEIKLDKIREEAVKRPVVFLVKTLQDTTAGTNKILKFTESVWNTDDVYDSTSGYFAAPINGTYMFNLQLCYANERSVHAQLVADDMLIANALLYSSGTQCSTLSAVAVLSQGGRVCARHGGVGSSGDVLYQQEGYRWAAFMGALVN